MCRQHRLPGNRCAGRPRADMAAGVPPQPAPKRQAGACGLRACSQCPLVLPLSGTPRGLTPYSLVRTYSHSRASPEAHIPCAANNSQTCLHPPPPVTNETAYRAATLTCSPAMHKPTSTASTATIVPHLNVQPAQAPHPARSPVRSVSRVSRGRLQDDLQW